MSIDRLHLYKDSALTNQISEGTNSNPDSVSGDGLAGFTTDTKLYCGVTASPGGYKYTTVTITEQSEPAGVNCKYATDTAGTPGTYNNGPLTLAATNTFITPGNYVAFWRRITVASSTDPANYTGMKHRLGYTEYAV